MSKFLILPITATLIAMASATSAAATSTSLHAPCLTAFERIKDPALPDIVTERPEGVQKDYSRSGGAYYAVMGSVSTEIFEGIVAEMIEGDDGFVYLHNPFSQADTGSYLKLERTDGNTLVAHLPQAITQGTVNSQTITLYANRMNYTVTSAPGQDQEGTYLVDSDNNTITYTLTDGKWVMEGGEQIDTILGLADAAGNWYGYGEFNTVFTPFTDTLTELPSGLEPRKWAMTYGYDGHFINAAISGSDIYLQGLSTYFPDSWVKGTVSGESVTIPSRQYIGIEKAYTHYCYFNGAEVIPVYNEYLWDYVDTFTPKEDVVMAYDPETSVMTTDEGMVVTTLGERIVLEVEGFARPTLRPVTDNMSLTPANPIITLYEPYDPDYGFGAIEFILPVTNTEGILLDKANLTYRLYLDNTPFTFTPADYPFLSSDMELVPYTFEGETDILVMGASHTVFFYCSDYSRMGVQTVYDSGNTSAIVYTDSEGGISAPATDTPAAVSTEYFDLLGRPVASPTSGLFIRRTTLSDGSVKVSKALLR